MIAEWIPTLGVAALVMLMIYRRGRRLFTRQRFGSRRLLVRMAIVGSICVLLLPILLLARGVAPAIGLGLGLSLGLLARTLTKFEVTEQGLFFTPNAYVGVAVMSLFLGRMIYRLTAIGAAGGSPFRDGFQRSPMTAAVVAVLIGYYVTYYAAIFARGRRLLQQGQV